MEKEGRAVVELNASPRVIIILLIALGNRLQMPNLETLVKTEIQDQVRNKKNELLDPGFRTEHVKNIEWEPRWKTISDSLVEWRNNNRRPVSSVG